MEQGTPAKRRCAACGGPIRRDNMDGFCRRTLECRRAKMDHWRKVNGIVRKQRTKAERGCKVPECPKPHYGHGYCMMHWARVKKNDDPGPAESTRKPIVIGAGETFGRWMTLEAYTAGAEFIRCRCECGTESSVMAETLRKGTSRSCGCAQSRAARDRWKRRRGGAPYLAAGDTFGYLTVLENVMYSRDQVRCRCACGLVTAKTARAVRNGHTQSCGCLQLTVRTTHGLSGHPLYGIWHGIIQRTTNPNAKAYPDYGGRGIAVCERWRDVAVFIADIERDIGPRPTGHSLDRIDTHHGNYEPGAVRWAPPDLQTQNRRKVRDLERENAALRARIAALEAGSSGLS